MNVSLYANTTWFNGSPRQDSAWYVTGRNTAWARNARQCQCGRAGRRHIPTIGAALKATIREAGDLNSACSARQSDTSVIHGRRQDRSDVVGVGRFELPASFSQSGKSTVLARIVLCRFVSECNDLAGVMGARSGTEQHRTTHPGAPRTDTSLIHRGCLNSRFASTSDRADGSS